jgi:predicted alpha/beta superfamily hydrolase
MANEKEVGVITENLVITSVYLKRDVKVDCYLPSALTNFSDLDLLLINDGQDLVTMNFAEIMDTLYDKNEIVPIFCIGLHCSSDRKNEYGTSKILDYKGRGAKAGLYTSFIFEELLPFIRETYNITSFKDKSFAGFSLGGLCAMDIVWNNPTEFTRMGAFSGSFWWRDMDQEDEAFDENNNRIMQRQIRDGDFYPWLNFFFEVGTQDETADRNNNGVIDSIDDTVALIEELHKKGYTPDATYFLQLDEGRHDVQTWASAFPAFFKWGWGRVAGGGLELGVGC